VSGHLYRFSCSRRVLLYKLIGGSDRGRRIFPRKLHSLLGYQPAVFTLVHDECIRPSCEMGDESAASRCVATARARSSALCMIMARRKNTVMSSDFRIDGCDRALVIDVGEESVRVMPFGCGKRSVGTCIVLGPKKSSTYFKEYAPVSWSLRRCACRPLVAF
jgi:hypothetical protein